MHFRSTTAAFSLLAAFSFAHFTDLDAQNFMMQGWFWDYPKPGCNGFPTGGQTWATNLTSKIPDLKTAGFNYLWIPPATRASFGQCSNGYDPSDLYDLGSNLQSGQLRTGFGTRAQVNSLVATMQGSNAINPVADVIYNHRDGGRAEANSGVRAYFAAGAGNPFPNDRMRFALPIGGATGRDAGLYRFKMSSARNGFVGVPYKMYFKTTITSTSGAPSNTTESEPNGGEDCSQVYKSVNLHQDISGIIETQTMPSCGTDEFGLNLSAGQFLASGDTIFIYARADGGGYHDLRPYSIEYEPTMGTQIECETSLLYQTYTDFTQMKSGQGNLNYLGFKPNGITPTTLSGDWDEMLFFYDYEQNHPSTAAELQNWSKWLWDDVGIRGYRMDAVKHFPGWFVRDILQSLNAAGKNPGMVVGEVFDTNADNLTNWMNSVYAGMNAATSSSIYVRTFDFELRQALKDASDNFGYDVRQVFSFGIVDRKGWSGNNVVTFLNNHDYRGGGEPIQNNPHLGYAYILTNNRVGTPTVFYPDYYGISIPNYPTVNLKNRIDQLIKLHKTWITGASQTYLANDAGTYPQEFLVRPAYLGGGTYGFPHTTLTYQGSGGTGEKEVIVAINYAGDTMKLKQKVRTINGVSSGTIFTDMLGYDFEAGAQKAINSSNEIYIELPPFSYTVFVQGVQTPLPIELISFSANYEKPNAARLNWELAEEKNVKGYWIEKLIDDAGNFDQIGFVRSLGDSNEKTIYEFLDDAFFQSSKYRIAQVSIDGTIDRSPVVHLKNPDRDFHFSLFPNPTDGDIQIEATSGDLDEKLLTITLAHPSGQILAKTTAELSEINAFLPALIARQSAGPLLLSIEWDGGRQTIPFLKH